MYGKGAGNITPVSETTASTLSDELLAGVLAYVLDNGLADLSLRPLAEALNTSTFKLSYHFGSKGELVQAVVEAAVTAQIREVRSWLAQSEPASVGTVMKQYWSWFCQPENQKASRMFFELNGLALRDPETFPNALQICFTEGIELEKQIIAHTGYRGKLVEQYATVVCAASWGLQLDLLNTGDVKRTTQAFNLIADFLDAKLSLLQERQQTPDPDTAN